jgi:hypothetical protein
MGEFAFIPSLPMGRRVGIPIARPFRLKGYHLDPHKNESLSISPLDGGTCPITSQSQLSNDVPSTPRSIALSPLTFVNKQVMLESLGAPKVLLFNHTISYIHLLQLMAKESTRGTVQRLQTILEVINFDSSLPACPQPRGDCQLRIVDKYENLLFIVPPLDTWLWSHASSQDPVLQAGRLRRMQCNTNELSKYLLSSSTANVITQSDIDKIIVPYDGQGLSTVFGGGKENFARQQCLATIITDTARATAVSGSNIEPRALCVPQNILDKFACRTPSRHYLSCSDHTSVIWGDRWETKTRTCFDSGRQPSTRYTSISTHDEIHSTSSLCIYIPTSVMPLKEGDFDGDQVTLEAHINGLLYNSTYEAKALSSPAWVMTCPGGGLRCEFDSDTKVNSQKARGEK